MAGRIALDLKQFKHKSSDDKSSTLEHRDGHVLTIAHKPLSKEFRDQLEAMSKSKEVTKDTKKEQKQPQKLAKGGSVLQDDEQLQQDELSPMGNPLVSNDVKAMLSPRAPIATDFPTEEDLRASKEQEFQDEIEKIKSHGLGAGLGQDSNQIEKAALDNLQSRKDAKEAALLQAAADEKAKEAQRGQLDEQRMKLGLKPAEETISAQTPTEQAAPQIEAQLPQASDIGKSPASTTAVPQATLTPGQDPASIMQKGFKSEMEGIDAEAAAKGALGEKQADVLSKQLDAQNQAMQSYEKERAMLETERQNHIQDIKDGHINPEKYWTGDPKTGEGSHSRIATAIGMIIAGFNPAGTPNAAVDFLNKQMDRNLDAQAKNLQSKHNLLAENMRQFGNLKDAVSMTRIMQADIVQNQLLTEAAKASNPLAKAAALKAAGELQMKYAPEFQKFIGMRAVQGLKQAAMSDPSKMGAYFAGLDAADPTGKLRKEAEERAIPGVGFATSSEGAKGMREMGTTVNTVKQSIARLKEIAKKGGKSMNPTLIAEADTIRSMLIGQLRVPITGPGAMSEGERELLMRAVPDVTSMLSLDASNIKRLDSIEQKITDQYRNQAQINGIDPNNIPGMQVIRRTADGKEAIFDASTKKFLRYK